MYHGILFDCAKFADAVAYLVLLCTFKLLGPNMGEDPNIVGLVVKLSHSA